MAVKTITVTEEAYHALARMKEKDDSFSRVILRVAKRKPLSSFFGVLSKEAGEELEKNVRETRKLHRRLYDKRMKRIVEALDA